MVHDRSRFHSFALLGAATLALWACGSDSGGVGPTAPPPAPAPAPAPPPPPASVDDRPTLEAIYHATDGPNWLRNDGWLTSMPLAEWQGVKSGREWSGRPIGPGRQPVERADPRGTRPAHESGGAVAFRQPVERADPRGTRPAHEPGASVAFRQPVERADPRGTRRAHEPARAGPAGQPVERADPRGTRPAHEPGASVAFRQPVERADPRGTRPAHEPARFCRFSTTS